MFQWSAFTDEISQDLAHACAVCNEFGVTGAEIREVWNTNVSEFSRGQVREIREILADHRMTVSSIGSPFGKCELEDRAAVSRHMDLLRRCADIGMELGCSLVRGFVFLGHNRVEKPWDRILRAFDPVPGILEEYGVTLGVENEYTCYVGTASHLRIFLDRFGCARAKAIWDPANHVQDVEGALLPSFPDGYRLIQKDLVHVHMKDAQPAPDGTVPNVYLGQGSAHWPEQFQALKDDGYSGYVSLETHVNAEECPAALRANYGGYLTEAGREGASKVCLAWARDIVSGLR